MKYLAALTFLCAFLTSFSSHALMIEPGLWKIDMEISQDGERIDPMAELRKAMKDMPEERKKQMQQAMKESGMAGEDMRQCYTKKMIEEAELGVHEDKDCKTETVKKTDKIIVSHFECKDGSKGTATINIKNKKSYEGRMKMTGPNGEKSELKYDADFVSKDCGNVKPLEA